MPLHKICQVQYLMVILLTESASLKMTTKTLVLIVQFLAAMFDHNFIIITLTKY